jgi:hypothetical protein
MFDTLETLFIWAILIFLLSVFLSWLLTLMGVDMIWLFGKHHRLYMFLLTIFLLVIQKIWKS